MWPWRKYLEPPPCRARWGELTPVATVLPRWLEHHDGVPPHRIRGPLRVCVCLWTNAWPLTSPPTYSVVRRKTIAVRVIDRDEYDKQASFYIELQEPYRNQRRWTGVGRHVWAVLHPSFLLLSALLLLLLLLLRCQRIEWASSVVLTTIVLLPQMSQREAPRWEWKQV